ncbi:NADH-quinone oxidoreductase subunit C [Rhodoferax sp. 4810]|uniref:NADH-quinone oxidoreductase subunit C n=1 Tax=Thiospirillum jenense TaxID=1653858 RepID=A0A839HGY8_9GAMM|nr:NADH-quinone oxidoreductase subunit C [Thiospirillum jenense]MBB1074299.1 NADH-quinone oxidoreductase subunit C [Rhodoferax jenense]MBB1126496.1 NADH-quinone oxidoreductase subunit C [Thiospirillum jenense]
MIDSALTTGDARLDTLALSLNKHFAQYGCALFTAPSEVTLVVPAHHLSHICLTLRDHQDFCFEQLIDLCGVDYAAYGQSEWETTAAATDGFGRAVDRDPVIDNHNSQRFAVVYHLLSLQTNRRLRVRVYADAQQPRVTSVIDIWPVADWFEREAFDLFGILFDGHPDLRRILTDYGFIGHPFRKDFPLSGHVAMRYDPDQRRVIYEPVTIAPRVLVPRVTRDDGRYLTHPNHPAASGDNHA